jgi:hypothetical protein
MNVLILTPDRVGSTLLQRVLTIYMLRRGFDKPVINLHELTNGLQKYYNTTLNQEVLGKSSTEWGYHQSLNEITELLSSVDHYKTSRLAHYHIVERQDGINDQLPFYKYLNENFFIISCRRDNLFEHALSWAINGYSKKLNVYSPREKVDAFYNIYKNKITVSEDTLIKYLQAYRDYISWSDRHFNIQSHFYYDREIKDIESYILNLDFMHGHQNNTWQDMFNLDFADYNTYHSIIPNLVLNDVNLLDKQIVGKINTISSHKWDLMKGVDWPMLADLNNTEILNQVPANIKLEIDNLCTAEMSTINVRDHNLYNFLINNLDAYRNISAQVENLVASGFLVTGVPIKLQSLSEKKSLIKNFNDCIQWYNKWVHTNNFGTLYTEEELSLLSDTEDLLLTKSIKL